MKCPNCKTEFFPKIRSNEQNKYYWSVILKIISDHTGYSIYEAHELMKLKFNSKILHINNDEVTIGCSTAGLTTVEYETFLSHIRQWASQELNCYIPEPNEGDIDERML